MKPVSFITSRMSANGQGGKCTQRPRERAHFTLRFAGSRLAAFAKAADKNERLAREARRFMVIFSFAEGAYQQPPGRCQDRDLEKPLQGRVKVLEEQDPKAALPPAERNANETTVVFRDSAFTDHVAKTNLAAILQHHGLENVRSLTTNPDLVQSAKAGDPTMEIWVKGAHL
jgi:nicotinamidase-related amidase